MVKPLSSEVEINEVPSIFGIGSKRFLISLFDVT